MKKITAAHWEDPNLEHVIFIIWFFAVIDKKALQSFTENSEELEMQWRNMILHSLVVQYFATKYKYEYLMRIKYNMENS